ncbi:MAG: hypothetical protein BAJALOKI1v1_1620002 [Promethearchaeota archaeon]|nr:MAG: hypothetical protein BAJALOKI1v1_1620002 [Candidatus Lokiarchaeota archaeon]
MSNNEPFILRVSRYHPSFLNRTNRFQSIDELGNTETLDEFLMENDLIICDGCNRKITDEETNLLCYEHDGQIYVSRCECDECVQSYYSDLNVIDETKNNPIKQMIATLTQREKVFAFNFFSAKTTNRELDRLNYLRDLRMYQYPHTPQLSFLFTFLFNNENLVKSLV